MTGSKKFHPSGVIVPMVTPFKGESMSEVDYESLDRLTDHLIENGVSGLMPLGTSGEFALMSKSEREEVVQRVVRQASGRIPVIAGISEPGTQNAITLARSAQKAGADALIATGPFYFKTTEDGLLLHYQMLLDCSELPLMIYNIPGYVGYNIPPQVVKKISDRNPGRVVGVKFTTNDLVLFLEYIRVLGDTMQIMIGSDSLFTAALDIGAAGGVLGSANVLPREVCSIYTNFKQGDMKQARELQKRVDGFTSAMIIGTYPAAVKYALKLIGLNCGDVRPPLVPLSGQEMDVVESSIRWKISL
ncbi:MAG: 4-hydroxy-tetrahydrodipicolinate synthase [Nitrososphaerales archaeon]